MPDPPAQPAHLSHGRVGIPGVLEGLNLRQDTTQAWPCVTSTDLWPVFWSGICWLPHPAALLWRRAAFAWQIPAEIIAGLVLVSSFEAWCYKPSGCGVLPRVLRFFHGVCMGTSMLSNNLAPHSQLQCGLALSWAPFRTKPACYLQAGCSSGVSFRACIRFGFFYSTKSPCTIPVGFAHCPHIIQGTLKVT